MLRLCRPRVDGYPEKREQAVAEWNTLWQSLTPYGIVVENLEPPRTTVVGLMVGVLVPDDCVDHCVAAPEPYLLSNVARLISSGRTKAPTIDDIAICNSGDGSNLLVCYLGWFGQEPSKEPSATIRGLVVNAFSERHGGNRIKLMLGEVGEHLLDVAIRYGTKVLNDYSTWAAQNGVVGNSDRPYVVGVEKEDGLAGGNFWIQRMFTYFPPRFLFTASQREILLLAREGYTDVEIAQKLEVTTDAIKRRWVKIYGRVQEVFPALLPSSPEGSRGQEKRRALLNHLRDRPEEMRPYARRPNVKG